MGIGAAIDGRWIGASLEDSISKLYLGSGYINEKSYADKLARMVVGTPESEGLAFPRSEFSVMPRRTIKMTPDCKVCEQHFFIYVWTDQEADLTGDDGFLDQIELAFNQGHRASTAPFKWDAATVMSCDVEGTEFYPIGHNDLLVFVGEVHVKTMYSITNTTPDGSGSS